VKRTAIEWTEITWNPVTGCDRVSEGCEHCYAPLMMMRPNSGWVGFSHSMTKGR